jgi:predicted TIM-barrel fold metal-dependent hydrolase
MIYWMVEEQLFPQAKLSPMEYLKRGNLYVSTEVEDVLLPEVIELVGEKQMVFGTDMPHGDRERFAGANWTKRKDINDLAKAAMLEANPARLYGLS